MSANRARAQAVSGIDAINGPTSRPFLQELNRESQSLFKEVSGSIARVQLPLGPEALMDDALAHWADQLDPDMRRRLEELQRRSPQNQYVRAEIQPATKPSDPAGDGPHEIVIQLSRFSPNCIGIIVDDKQNLFVPHFVDKAAFDGPVPIQLSDGRLAMATFVASDLQADMTILKLNGIKGKAAVFGPNKPAQGELILVVSMNPAYNRLAVWEGWQPDLAVLVNIDGQISGFSKNGRFLSASAYQPVIAELIEHGSVRRAILGVRINTIGAEDPRRMADASLGTTPAIIIKEVGKGSPAEKGGLLPGDLILTLAGESVGDAPTFAAAIANRRGKTELQVLRDGKRLTLTVDLEVH